MSRRLIPVWRTRASHGNFACCGPAPAWKAGGPWCVAALHPVRPTQRWRGGSSWRSSRRCLATEPRGGDDLARQGCSAAPAQVGLGLQLLELRMPQNSGGNRTAAEASTSGGPARPVRWVLVPGVRPGRSSTRRLRSSWGPQPQPLGLWLVTLTVTLAREAVHSCRDKYLISSSGAAPQ